MTVSTTEMLQFIDRALTVRLATISRKGTPLLTPLWFARDGNVIYLGTRRGSLHARHVTENSQVLMLFGDRDGKRTRRVLRVTGTARVCAYETMSFGRKVRMAWRYFIRPVSLAHWIRHWRKISVRNRYYSERTDSSMMEILVGSAELLQLPA